MPEYQFTIRHLNRDEAAALERFLSAGDRDWNWTFIRTDREAAS